MKYVLIYDLNTKTIYINPGRAVDLPIREDTELWVYSTRANSSLACKSHLILYKPPNIHQTITALTYCSYSGLQVVSVRSQLLRLCVLPQSVKGYCQPVGLPGLHLPLSSSEALQLSQQIK